jgi:PAS domain S-box-containing protein
MLKLAEILNASILVVDDQEANVMLLEQMLRNEGYTNITTTQRSRDVVKLYADMRFDLILLDLQMPEMDGFEVMEGLKQIDPSSYLPVLVITAQPGHKLRALKAGAKDFVSKPFDFVEVQTRIHNMLEVRLLYRKLNDYNRELEQKVLERTAALRESEARFQRFTELSSDWYWEQDAAGNLTQFSGPVKEMLGIGDKATVDGLVAAGWNAGERAALDAKISNRESFLDFVYSRTLPDGRIQYLQVSGEPMFDSSCGFAGYRGIGLDVTDRMRGQHQLTK